MSLFAELKRRRVFRVAIVYGVVAWFIIQVADTIVPRLGLPDWSVTLIILLAGLGLPLTMVLAWFFDVSPDGVQRTEPASAPATPASASARAAGYIGLGMVIALVSFAAYSKWPRGEQTETALDSIAVLPFVNMSSDPEQEYFSDGLTEELLNALAQVTELRVAARTSSFSFKGKNVPVADIARTLNVATVLEGSVRRDGNKVRITAQLINASNGYHLWSEAYDRELTDIFAIQEEIARNITDAMKVTLGAQDKAALAQQEHDVEAYNLYLQARFFWNKRTGDDLLRAQQLLEQAIARDSTFARAYSALADVYILLPEYADADPEYANRGIETARRAIALDNSLAEPYATIGNALGRQARWQEAESSFRKSIELNPNYATAHQWYGWHLAYVGRGQEALREMREAHELDPLSIIISTNLGEHLLYAKDYAASIAQYERTLVLQPSYVNAKSELSRVYALAGDSARALALVNELSSLPAPGTWVLGDMAFVYARYGQRERARALIAELQRRQRYALQAPAYVALNELEQALTALEKAVATNDPTMDQLALADQRMEPIRNTPRFQAFLRSMNLAPPR